MSFPNGTTSVLGPKFPEMSNVFFSLLLTYTLHSTPAADSTLASRPL